MTSIPMIDLFTTIFVLVDDWYKSKGTKLVDQSHTIGVPARCAY